MKGTLSRIAIGMVAGAVLVWAPSASASITGLPLLNPHPPAFPILTPDQPSGPVLGLGGPGPITGASWAGLTDLRSTPPDPNGAIGPTSYIEIMNSVMGIYTRGGAPISTVDLASLTGHSSVSDPMVLWDPATQRFYYNVWDTGNQTMAWGFSKNSNPTTASTSFCNYTASFGYTRTELPDYPKLGQSKYFLMIGVNHYPNSSAQHDDRSDLLWIDKPQGSAPITTCPAAATFLTGSFKNLRNQDGSEAFTPVPAIQSDSSATGWVLTSSDIETPCPGCRGTKLTVHTLTPKPGNPKVALFTTTGRSITVPAFSPPATAVPQKGSTHRLDSLDGRLQHAVAAIDPRSNQMVLWTGHSVNSTGNRTEFRWYEVLPSATASLVSSGVVKSASLFVWNGAVAPDRTVTPAGAAHGGSIVIGFTTSSSTTLPADQMVSKVGGRALSPFVMVHKSATPDSDFSCTQLLNCRWGDYGGATPDPAPRLLGAAQGEVWLSNEAVSSGNNTTWNWEAKP